jgi:hypothetical protein
MLQRLLNTIHMANLTKSDVAYKGRNENEHQLEWQVLLLASCSPGFDP